MTSFAHVAALARTISTARMPWRALVAALACMTLLACAPKSASPSAPQVEPAEPARQLPAFEIEREQGPSGERFAVELGDAPVRGPDDAAVTIVMFSDFECPYCERGHDTMLELEREYQGRVRFVYKAYPLGNHEQALWGAMAARAAHVQGKFWPYHDLLFSGQGIDDPQLVAFAEQVGLDAAKLRRELEDLTHAPAVARDLRQGRRFGVTSTPTFFINGRVLHGARPLDEFRTMVEEELAFAKQLTDKGVAAKDVYRHAIAGAYRGVRYSEAGRELDPDVVQHVPVGDSPQLGPATAPVTIVEFGDFQCPFCARGGEIIQALRRRYGDQVRIVYKHNPLPFHSLAFVAARASMAAHEQGKFWAYHDALYARGARFDDAVLISLARDVGLDRKRFTDALNSTRFDATIARDLELGASLGVTGTPAYFINGRALEGARPELHFRLIIEEELERARKAVAAGTRPSDIYEVLSHTALE